VNILQLCMGINTQGCERGIMLNFQREKKQKQKCIMHGFWKLKMKECFKFSETVKGKVSLGDL